MHRTIELLERRRLLSVAQLVKDIDPGSFGFEPRQLTAVNGTLFFTGVEPGHGFQLWKTDGTKPGTVVVKDIGTGEPGSSPSALMNFGGTLYFVAADTGQGLSLWRSDGTSLGTMPVKSLAGPPGVWTAGPQHLTAAGNRLFFPLNEGSGNPDLWVSDTTAAGTMRLTPTSGPILPVPDQLVALNGKLYFTAHEGITAQLWTSDGTAAGTRLITDRLGDGAAQDLAVAGDRLFFLGGGTSSGFPLFTSDGTTSGTKVVATVAPKSDVSEDTFFAPVGNSVYFLQPDALGKAQVWKSDGTAAGTVRDGALLMPPGARSLLLGELGGTLILGATDGAATGLWKTDGTAAGTSFLAPALPWSDAGVSDAAPVVAGGTMYFMAAATGQGYQLWGTDGTAGGTRMIEDIQPFGSSFPSSFAALGTTAFFDANDGVHGWQLWKTDGTAAGTQSVTDIAIAPASGRPVGLTRVGERLFFTGHDVHGAEPWVSDGTAAGTTLVKDLNPLGDSIITDYVDVNGTAYFIKAGGGPPGIGQLWRSDGTDAGTIQIPSMPYYDPRDLRTVAAVAGTLYFTGFDSAHGWGLWKTDGTAAGTGVVQSFSDVYGHIPSQLVDLNGLLLFQARDSRSADMRLYRSDGTAAGTVPITPTGSEFSFSDMAIVGGELYFLRSGQLWKTDGTASGTLLIKPLTTAIPDGQAGLTSVDGTLFFLGGNAGHLSLYKSDGTSSGTVLVKDFGMPYGGLVENLTASGGLLYFTLNGGDELWESDGTDAGTHVLAGGTSMVAAHGFQDLTDAGGTLFFAAADTAHGAELWKTDGTTNGTRLVQDIDPGPTGALPQWLTVVKDRLFFSADDGVHGRELWAVDLSGSVGGMVFEDTNHNKTRDASERGFAGIMVLLDPINGGSAGVGERSTLTGPDGSYTFDALPPGLYEVSVVPPAGYRRTTPLVDTARVVVRPQQQTAAPDFGLVNVATVPMEYAYLTLLARNYGRPGTFADGDMDGDGLVDFKDLVILARHYGHLSA